jgi:nitrous oxide reductase
MLQSRVIMVIIVAVAASVGGGILTFAIGLPSSPCFGVRGTTHNFTIIAGVDGYNASRNHQAPWPVMTVNRCDMVVITIVNSDTQAHGFAVDYYAVKGTEVQYQQAATVQFLASRAGAFRVYCNVYCTVHIFMQDGLLNVT